jgi:hypothetical protein
MVARARPGQICVIDCEHFCFLPPAFIARSLSFPHGLGARIRPCVEFDAGYNTRGKREAHLKGRHELNGRGIDPGLPGDLFGRQVKLGLGQEWGESAA